MKLSATRRLDLASCPCSQILDFSIAIHEISVQFARSTGGPTLRRLLLPTPCGSGMGTHEMISDSQVPVMGFLPAGSPLRRAMTYDMASLRCLWLILDPLKLHRCVSRIHKRLSYMCPTCKTSPRHQTSVTTKAERHTSEHHCEFIARATLQLPASHGLLADKGLTSHTLYKPTQVQDCRKVCHPDETPTYMAAFAMRGVSPLVNPFTPCSLHSCRTIALSVGL